MSKHIEQFRQRALALLYPNQHWQRDALLSLPADAEEPLIAGPALFIKGGVVQLSARQVDIMTTILAHHPEPTPALTILDNMYDKGNSVHDYDNLRKMIQYLRRKLAPLGITIKGTGAGYVLDGA